MINCIKIADKIKKELIPLVDNSKQLAIIQVGDNPASNIYVKHKLKDAESLGVIAHYYNFLETSSNEQVLDLIKKLNVDKNIKGIILQLPLPSHMNEDLLVNAIVDEKDIDGFKPTSKFTPCTPKGIMAILDNSHINLVGKSAVIIGKGKTVGRPLINLLLDRGITVTVCHSRSKREDLLRATSHADIIISAVGHPNIVTKDMINEANKELIVIDVGISRDENGKQIGDCAKELHDIVHQITGYTQSVGLMTRTMLLQNLLED